MIKIIASEVAVLDSNVNKGGGTDATEALQKVLDMAPENGGIHLVMDGAALVRGLKVYSNTVIECSNSDCGFYMADYSNRPIISNYNWSFKNINTRNVSLIGGTYNQNSSKQAHDVPLSEYPYPEDVDLAENVYEGHGVYLIEMYGIENYVVKDIHFKNQRMYTVTTGNFKNVRIENCSIKIDELIFPSHQDGFHFFGPGQFLTMKNVSGCTGDDFINLAADEMDRVSSITDVLIDGVFLDGTYQGIRMLSRGTGVLDRITVRNVTGSYRTFAFSIMPFYREKFGKYGDILIENVNLKQLERPYNYTPLTFMQLGGDMECITLKNIRFRGPERNSSFIELGLPFFYRPQDLTDEEIERYSLGNQKAYTERWSPEWMYEDKMPRINNFVLEDVIFESDSQADGMKYIEGRYFIDNFIVRNVKLFRDKNANSSGNLVSLKKSSQVSKLFIEDVYVEKVESVVNGETGHSIDEIFANNVVLKDGKAVFDIDASNVKTKIQNSVYEINS